MSRKTTSRRIHIRSRLTGSGWLLLTVAGIIFIVGLNNQISLVFVLFGCMIGALHISVMVGRRMLSGVQLRREIPTRVWQNQTVHLGYYLRNTRRRGACLGISIEEIGEGIECAGAYCTHIAPQTVFRAGGRFAAARRGRFRMRNVRLATLFPFGLVRVRKTIPQDTQLVIWPATGQLKMQLLHLGAADLSQSAPSQATGGQDEFFGLREYRTDDNPRWIHWRRSASRTVPVVREMSRPLQEVLWVILDTEWTPEALAHGGSGAEKFIRLAATLVDHGLSRGYHVGLALAQGPKAVALPASAGRGQHRLLLDALSDVSLGANAPLATTLSALDGRSIKDAVAVLITSRPGMPGVSLGGPRRLTVVHAGNLDSVFEDQPPAAEAPPCPS